MTERKAPEQPPLFEGVEPKPLPPIEERADIFDHDPEDDEGEDE